MDEFAVEWSSYRGAVVGAVDYGDGGKVGFQLCEKVFTGALGVGLEGRMSVGKTMDVGSRRWSRTLSSRMSESCSHSFFACVMSPMRRATFLDDMMIVLVRCCAAG